ncbi:hypothetical protein [Streptomyces sp. NPDC058751]|uniref:hypothetical protein n=1 Tax=Streptomyces sp. NPDC058751 TaxID=3346623 RepID=UPI00368123A2
MQSLTQYVEQLEALGAIEVEKQRYQGKMRQRCVYTIHMVPPDGYTGPMDLDQWSAAHTDLIRGKKPTEKATAPGPEPKLAVEPTPVPEADAASTPAAPAEPRARKPRKKAEKSPEEQALEDKATAGAEWWWGQRKTKANPEPKPGRLAELVTLKKMAPYVGNKSSAYHATRTLILNALKANYAPEIIAKALEDGGRAFPSRQQFEDACAVAAGVNVNRPRPGGTGRTPAYNDDATWRTRKQQKSSPPQGAKPAEDDEFGLRGLADSA